MLAFAQTQENITITTYYPSPSGVYREMQLFPAQNPRTPCTNWRDEGRMYFNNATQQLMVCSSFAGGADRRYYPVGGTGGYWIEEPGSNPLNIRSTNAGNVGIGTTSPNQRLHVVGNANVTGNVLVGGNNIVSGNVGINTNSPSQRLHVVGDANVTGNAIVGGNNIVSGSVGINTNSPSQRLHVVGNALITGNLQVNNNITATNITATSGITLGGVRRTSWPDVPNIWVESKGTSYDNDHEWLCCSNDGKVIAVMAGYSGETKGDDKDVGVTNYNGTCAYVREGSIKGDVKVSVWLTCMN
ncbi:MAG: hypothetical protein N2606_03355 [Candidatus Omnitrophica bacterium]|nr:hypothetical protein [Candidatus Omnitrophota bacterium]